MKIPTKLFLVTLTFIVVSLSAVSSKNSLLNKSKANNNYWITPYIKTAKSFISFANLPYCNLDVINALTCPLCSSIIDGSYKVQKAFSTTFEKREFKYVILKSDPHKEIVVSFGGPKLVNDHEFFATIYSFGYDKFRGVQVEKIFLNVYKNEMQKNLKTKISELLKNKDTKNYKFIFVGHGIGGSLATLAAFDLVKEKVVNVNKDKTSPIIYSYGQFKIGNDDFVKEVNSLFKVVRIVKNSDWTPLLSNCKYEESVGKYVCGKEAKNLGSTVNAKNEPQKKSPGEETKRYNPTTFNMAYAGSPLRSSFLEATKQVDFHYGGQPNDSYYKYTDNDKFFYQPIGSEVLFSESFKKWQVCSITEKLNGKCERTIPKFFDPKENSNYFNQKVDTC